MSTPNPFAPFAFDFPVVMTVNGVQPQSPANLLNQLLAAVAVQEPGYTANLPGSLIDDVSGTQVGSMVLIDQARVESINSLTPFAANLFILTQLGNVYGPTQGSVTNTSVLVTFSGPNAVGYVIPNGMLVSDGTNTYQIQGGGVVSAGGSPPLQAIALASGSFSVPAGTVTQILTSVPPQVQPLSVTNPLPGSPGTGAESPSSFRSRVLTAGLAACVGSPRFIKTMIGQVLGAQSNLISVQKATGGLKIVVGGSANPTQVAYAIFQSVADVTSLQGSTTPARNVTVSLIDPPDTYSVLYVNAPAQTVTMTITWNTVLTSFTGGAAFPGLVQGPIAAYINSLGIGQVINVFEMNEIFQQAVENVLDASLLTRLVFTVSINTVVTPPATGTGAISGDPESYFTCLPNTITVVQG